VFTLLYRFYLLMVLSGLLALPVLAQQSLPWQPEPLPPLVLSDSTSQLPEQYQAIAGQLLETATTSQQLRLLLLLNQNEAALKQLYILRAEHQAQRSNANPYELIAFELLAQARLKVSATEQKLDNAFADVFSSYIGTLSDADAHLASRFATRSIAADLSYLQFVRQKLASAATGAELPFNRQHPAQRDLWLQFFSAYADYYLHAQVLHLAAVPLELDRHNRYHIDTRAMIRTAEGIELSAMVVRSKKHNKPLPAILSASIYADEAGNLQHAIAAAARGYVGVVSDSRGKRHSTAAITPYENESQDVTAVINWISQQPWCDGQVAMYGGSYLGFTQWAAAKVLPAALKTIVPAAAAIPGQGLPMENNIFLNANYAWPFFVSNARYNDDAAYEAQDWFAINQQWYQSGRPYREFDQIAGQANPWLQKWLRHPSFDNYWQDMIPTAEQYARLTIPVLSITGYYDDGQISALQYVRDHSRQRPQAEHYLVIGPYDHFGAQHGSTTILRDYKLDAVAHLDLLSLTFGWFDYVLKGKTKPALLKDKITYQLMGDNSWRYAASLTALEQQKQRLYFSPPAADGSYQLQPKAPDTVVIAEQHIDFKDRSQSYNQHYYPNPIVQPAFVPENGLQLLSEPLAEDMALAGAFSGELVLQLNKKDVDLGLTLYEVTPDGQYFHLSYFLGRASYAKDPTRRQLLIPGQPAHIPFTRSRMVGKKISKGSRLLLLANVNYNAFAQINYGTGADVSDESIRDAAEPLQLAWLSGSYIDLPLRPMAR
jgi:putative CocE/NonD family hydrolase